MSLENCVSIKSKERLKQQQQESVQESRKPTLEQSSRVDTGAEISQANSSNEDGEKIKLLQEQVANLKTEKFQLISENLKHVEELEKFRQRVPIGEAQSTDEEELRHLLAQSKEMVESRENQLVRLININHLLTAQVRFLAARIHEPYDMSTYTPRASFRKDSPITAKAREDELENLDTEILKSIVQSLEGSQEGTRGELRAALKEYAAAELTISKQQARIDSLEDNLSRFREDLDNSSGSAGALKVQLRHKDGEIEEYKQLILSIQKKLNEKNKDHAALENENRILKENLSASEAARCDLTTICSEHIRNAKAEALENYKELTERLLAEREDVLSNLAMVSELERDVRNAISKEAMAELNLLREEHFKREERELQKDQEIAFLQQQLIEAAERLANFELDKKALR